MNDVAPLLPRLAVILDQARRYPPLSVAVVDAQEAHVLDGVVEANDAGLIEPVLLGPRTQIESVCRQLDCPINRFPIIDLAPASEAAEAGVQNQGYQQSGCGRCGHCVGIGSGCGQYPSQGSGIPCRGDDGRHRDRRQGATNAHLSLRPTRCPPDLCCHRRAVTATLGW